MKNFSKVTVILAMLFFVLAGIGGNALAFTEYPIGEEKIIKQMKIAAVYFQAVPMKPEEKAGLKAEESDLHLEADIHAVANNPYGFGLGAWVPNLTVDYTLENMETGEIQEGSFMPMAASDGPHYGTNVQMMGIGNYKLTYIIYPPTKQDFLQHTDKETGVEKVFWKKPIKVEWDFKYTGKV
ncbi:hypothetical protein C8C77_12844 [Halanaerobium saccharolyticum]|uniref:Periplasmic protein p19 involved in high-affinity Fe2+ transport n=1 Tax=Halanaerobium saccharolyticum TaxID=43595 RepID=A0A4R7YWR4_9FIRM|nr:iron transporter [Halanaerobium saccharolyticum]RAK10273.1 hypothetical protein C7958_10544 [Halanaerobium saccharolyticum]TDW00485.1 hypothetical protein C8C77_12844 [Halanaerobium saccharolyticum]TDX52070.1 hypothetical protein C7956_12744 [Halanaerobium saccharolyticum]